ncbi:hypothetical protein [Oceanobacillus sp. CAU 1775]
MIYRPHVLKFLFSIKDHIYRLKLSEKVRGLWLSSILLIIMSAIIYGWMGSLGIGSQFLSMDASLIDSTTYEGNKLWFMIGRIGYGILFAVLILFVPSLLFYYLADVPYQKLVVMQQVVLFVLLLERIIWIPLATLAGLDWYVSPLSLGVIVSYLTEIDWLIYFFGAISLFQIWVIWFQYRFLSQLSEERRVPLIGFVILLQIIGWALAATVALGDTFIIGRWFD